MFTFAIISAFLTSFKTPKQGCSGSMKLVNFDFSCPFIDGSTYCVRRINMKDSYISNLHIPSYKVVHTSFDSFYFSD